MRRRVKRDFSIIAGIVLVLGAVVFANYNIRRGDLTEKMDRWRRNVEQERKDGGLELLNWALLRKTKGTYRSGPKFHDKLEPKSGERVDVVGFMVPLEQFRQVSTFLLLPLPLECYFCQRPPMRDIMLVKLANSERKVDIYQEPVIINGDLILNEGPKQKFFYTLEGAEMGPGKAGGKLTKRKIAPEHMTPRVHESSKDNLQKPFDPKIGQVNRELVVDIDE